MKIPYLLRAVSLAVFPLLFLASKAKAQDDPPESTVGERLFLETRFAQFFFAHSNGDANFKLTSGDPVLDTTKTTGKPLKGPFAGQSMNCRACHLVDEQNPPAGNRTYCDFARRSPIPDRGDTFKETPRNSPPLVDALLPRAAVFLHFDGAFSTPEGLVKGTMTGRNFGWLPTEHAIARAHIANIIRHDDGSGDLAKDYDSLSYRTLLTGTSPDIPPDLQLPPEYRVDVSQATDAEILEGVASLVRAYMDGLVFAQNKNGLFIGSPYDVFLAKNGLPRHPRTDETGLQYARRLLRRVTALSDPQFVSDPDDGHFETHKQAFQFGAMELAGLKIFFAEQSESQDQGGKSPESSVGNCVACHTPPAFTDFLFHNTGATQEEYDAIHGESAFNHLTIPGLKYRRDRYDTFLPPTTRHPDALGKFIRPPSANHPEHVDLGLWNVWANPDFRSSQHGLREVLPGITGDKSPAEILPRTIALFKTPHVRDLGHSNPYLHTGRMDTIRAVIRFYEEFSNKARKGMVRNSDTELQKMFLDDDDVTPLVAFLRALNEDYN